MARLNIRRKSRIVLRAPKGVVRQPHGPKHKKQYIPASPEAHFAQTVEAKTIFVWPRFGLPCGVAEFANHLAQVAEGATCCKHPYEIKSAEHVVLVLMPDLTQYDPAVVHYLRRLGARVTLSIHHFSTGSNPFHVIAREVNDVVWHHPRIPSLAGFGRYVPLPVPDLSREPVERVGGLTHFGLGTPYKRFDVMVSIARDLATRLHCYGANNAGFIPPHSPHVVVDDSYPNERELARRIRQHDVGMIGRLPWGGHATAQINGSASARFFVAAGIPAVIDAAVTHEDLVGVLDVVPYDDYAATFERVRRLLTNSDYRSEALERAEQYARNTGPRNVAAAMGITCRAS